MPKKKGRTSQRRQEESMDALETASIVSLASEDSETPTNSSNDVEDIAVLQSLLEKINAASETLTEKRPETRIKALSFLIDTFRMHHLAFDETWNYTDTFFNGIETVLKKGKSHDQALAAECLSVFTLQFDSSHIIDCFEKFLPILEAVLRDVTAPCIFRTSCALTLAILQFLSGHCDFVKPQDLMKSFESVFKGSCLKGDGKAPALEHHVSLLHVAALRAWGLLFTVLPTHDVGPLGKAMVPTLISLLQGTCVDMRITAGEIAALIYERIRSEMEERFKGPYYTDLIRLLNDLATDSAKSRSKVDRKKQRHSFRELVDTISHSDISETTINFGSESLVLASCVDHFHYDFMCSLLKGGISRHLLENCQIRNLFDLGLPVMVSQTPLDRRSARDQKRLANSIAAKIRTQKLCSHRDRRSNVVGETD